MKYLHYFGNQLDMENAYGSSNYEEPWIGFVDPGNDEQPTIRTYNKYSFDKIEIEYVDLGLPSGNLWATKNLGAENIYNKGNYYAWGELTPKAYNAGTTSNYKFGWPDISKYNYTDGKYVLDSEDDVITQTYGYRWCMPTKEDCSELIQNINDGSEIINNIKVNVFTSKINGNKLYIPGDTSGYYFYIWTSSCMESSQSQQYSQQGYILRYDIFSDRWNLRLSQYNRYTSLCNVRGILRPNSILTQ